MNWSIVLVGTLILGLAQSPAHAKSKAFFKTTKRGVCVGGGCTNAPKVVVIVVDRVTRSDIGKITGNVAREAGIGLGNLERENRRFGGQVGIQLKRSQGDVGEMGTALYRFGLDEVDSVGKVVNNFEQRFREGKFVDALWHLGTEPNQETEKNAAQAAMESDVLSTIGSVAASAYGGPGGAAAYAAWLTYHKTCRAGECDPNLALRIGLIAGAANAGNAAAATVSDPIKRAALTGAIAGTAVAASGGKAAAINDAFFRAGASVLVQEGYRRVTDRDMMEASKPAFGSPLCMVMNPTMVGPTQCANGHAPEFMKSKNGNYLLLDENKQWQEVPPSELSKVPPTWKLIGDPSAAPQGTPVVGMQTDRLPPISSAYEGSPVMTTLAKIPGVNGMAIFHDRWAVRWAMTSDAAVMGSIPVAIGLIYTGDVLVYDAASSRAVIDAAIAMKKRSLGNSTAAAKALPNVARSPSPLMLRRAARRAASSAAEARLPPMVISSASEQNVLLPQSMMCTKGDQFRAFNVAWGKEKDDLLCAVVITEGDKVLDSAPWYARERADFCPLKIQDMAAPLLKAGWSCNGR